MKHDLPNAATRHQFEQDLLTMDKEQTSPKECPPRWLLEATLAGLQEEDEAKEIYQHLENCAICANYCSELECYRQGQAQQPLKPPAQLFERAQAWHQKAQVFEVETVSLTVPQEPPVITEPKSSFRQESVFIDFFGSQGDSALFAFAAMLVCLPLALWLQTDGLVMRTLPTTKQSRAGRSPGIKKPVGRGKVKVRPSILKKTPLRSKGRSGVPSRLQVRFQLFLRREQGFVKEASRMQVRVGDQIRFGYWLAGQQTLYLSLFSYDEKGLLSVLYPAPNEEAFALSPGPLNKRRLLPDGVLLDERIVKTHLYVCLTQTPLSGKSLLAKISSKKEQDAQLKHLGCAYQKAWTLWGEKP